MTPIPLCPMPAIVPPPPSSLVFFHIETLSTALTKLGITVPAQVIIDAVKEEEQKKVATSTLVGLARQIPDSSCLSAMSSALKFVERLSQSHRDPKSKERKKRLIAMTNDAFPPGNPLPDPYISALAQCKR